MNEGDRASPALRPTRVRYRVVGLCLGLAAVTYLDRACIGTLAGEIMRDLHLTREQMSWVFSAFGLAYAAFEVPTAWWADRQGTRRVLGRIVLWWSAFTLATAAVWSFSSMLVVRFLFGAGEAGAWPCVGRTFSRWIPLMHRGRVHGVFFAAAHLAGAITPAIALWLAGIVTWRGVFLVFGLLGFVWVVAWRRLFRDEPRDHPDVNQAEADLIAAGREPERQSTHAGWTYWRRLLVHRNTWPLCFAYVANSFAFYFCITWLPTYLQEKHGISGGSLGIFAGLPLMVAVIGDLVGGALTDWAVKRFGLRLGRVGVCTIGYFAAGIAMLSATFTASPLMAIGLISLAVGATMVTLGATWGVCQEIGGAHVGVVGAAMNTVGQLGGIAGPPLVTWLVGTFSDWNAPIIAIGAYALVGAGLWCLVDPRAKIFE